MRTLVTLITAAAFVLHFTLGCCAHHAHGAEEMVCPAHTDRGEHRHDDGHHHDHDGHDHQSSEPCDQAPENQAPQNSDSDCPGHHCSDGHCVFMAAGKTAVAKSVFMAVLPLFVAEPASFAVLSPHTIAAIDSGGLIALPVRTHLFNQVLLI